MTGSNRKNIVFIGREKVGKSSLVKAFIGSSKYSRENVPGEFVNSKKKTEEFFKCGNLILVDTPPVTDSLEPGRKKINKPVKAISVADFAVMVLDARERICPSEFELIKYLQKISVPYVIAVNKIEFGVNPYLLAEIKWLNSIHFEISCREDVGIEALKSKIIRSLDEGDEQQLISDLVSKGDIIVLVVPDDSSSTKSMFLIPQAQAIKEALEEETIAIIAKENELRPVLYALKNNPDLIIADSEAIQRIVREIPEELNLTTFSLIMSRYKGNLKEYVKGLKAVEALNDGDKVLIAEACSNHIQEDDISRVNLPERLRHLTNKNLSFEMNCGGDFPEDLSQYKLIIHCSGCMLTRQSMLARIKQAALLEVPIVTYGVLNSFVRGTINRELLPFGEAG